MNVLETTGDVVEAVFTFAGAVVVAGDLDRGIFGWQDVPGVVEGQADLRHSGRLPLFGAVKHQVLHALSAQVGRFGFTEYPADGIYNI